ncbi:discoidin domain-containing protein [Nocardia sp. NPDC003693]
MPDEHAEDLFLRHRAALLDALLSDPALGSSGPEAVAPVADSSPGTATEPGVPLTPGSDPDSDDLPGSPIRNAAVPKASERILALLNGQIPNDSPAHDFSTSLPDRTVPPLEEPRAFEERTSSEGPERSRPDPAERVRELVSGLRTRKAWVAIAAGLLLVLILVLITTGTGESPSGTTDFATVSPNTLAVNNSTTATAAAAATIAAKSAQAHCPPGGAPAADAFAGTGKAWSCARAYRVDGQVLTIDLGGTYRVDSIGVVPGWDAAGPDGADLWAKYRTVSRISYRFDDPNATTFTQQTLDQRTLVVTRIEPAVTATKIVLTVLESKGEPNVNSVALSSIVITGQ